MKTPLPRNGRLPSGVLSVLFISLALLLAWWTVHGRRGSFDTSAYLATVQSLVERRTFAIDGSDFVSTQDKVLANGHFYAAKPPLLAFAGAAAYLPLRALGWRLSTEWNLAEGVITFATVGLSYLLCLVCFFDGLRRFTGIPRDRAAVLTAGLAVATLFLPFSTTFSSPAFAGAWVFGAFYLLLRAQGSCRSGTLLLLAGVSAGLAAGADHSCLVYLLAFAVYAAWKQELRARVAVFLLPALLMILPAFLVYWTCSGDFRPFQLRHDLMHYPGSAWNDDPGVLTGYSRGFRHAVVYGFLCLFGPNGFLLYNPLLVIGLWGAVTTLRRRAALWLEAAMSLGAAALIFIYYAFSSNNFSGATYSIRWFVVTVPMLLFFGFAYLEKLSAAGWRLYAVLFAASLCFAVVGVYAPWQITRPGSPVFLRNLHEILTRLGLG